MVSGRRGAAGLVLGAVAGSTLVLVAPAASQAAGPAVTGSSGTLAYGAPLTVTGQGFGVHPDTHPDSGKLIKMWDDFDDNELSCNGYQCWDVPSVNAVAVAAGHPRTTRAGDRQYRRLSPNLGGIEFTGIGNERRYLATFYLRLSDRFDIATNPAGSHQFKSIRWWSRDDGDEDPAEGLFRPTALRSPGTSMPTGPTWGGTSPSVTTSAPRPARRTPSSTTCTWVTRWPGWSTADASDYAVATVIEPQLPKAWSAGRVDVQADLGALRADQPVYAFVTDEFGRRNATGYRVGGTPQVATFSPEADTYVYQSYPSTNYGTAPGFDVGGVDAHRVSHVRFNVAGLPVGARVTKAARGSPRGTARPRRAEPSDGSTPPTRHGARPNRPGTFHWPASMPVETSPRSTPWRSGACIASATWSAPYRRAAGSRSSSALPPSTVPPTTLARPRPPPSGMARGDVRRLIFNRFPARPATTGQGDQPGGAPPLAASASRSS